MYINYNFLILIIIFISFTIGLNLGLHGLIAFDQPIAAVKNQYSNNNSNNNTTTYIEKVNPPNKYETVTKKLIQKSYHSDSSSHYDSTSVKTLPDRKEIKSSSKGPDTSNNNAISAKTNSQQSLSHIDTSRSSSESNQSLEQKLDNVKNIVLRYLHSHLEANSNIAANNELVNPDAMGGGGNIPIVLLTCNRPALLKETIASLLQVRGVNKHNILVAQDGAMKEVSSIAKDNDLTVVQNTQGIRLRGGAGSDGASRIAQHYKFSLTTAFNRFPDADAVIVVEDDLLFSPDMYEYLITVGSVLVKDPSAFVVSAWSDNGFKDKVRDPYALRRTDYFPGLGWLLTRKLYKTELEKKWPSTHWDHWLRSAEISKHRDIIYPQVPRTYHNGIKGTFMNLETHNRYFRDIGYNMDASVSWALDSIDPLTVTTDNNEEIELPSDSYYLQVRKEIYDYRIEELIKRCVHVKSTTELVQLENEIVCVWVDINPDCERSSVPFSSVAAFFDIWHEHRRGNYKGVHEFYWDNSNYVLLINIFDMIGIHGKLRKKQFDLNSNTGEEKMTFRHLMPTTTKPLPAKQFSKSLLDNARRKKLGIKGYKADSPGMNCNQVCESVGKSCDDANNAQQNALNSCEALQEEYPCLSCQTSSGPEQPAYVKPDAATKLLPGTCLVTSTPHLTRCAASHSATYRLCACSPS